MNLRSYLDKNGLTVVDIASQAKVGTTSIYRILKGYKPQMKVCRKISEATQGAVSIEELRNGAAV